MKPQVQPNHASCTATAFAIVLGIDVQDIFIELGHDGTEVIWPHAPFPHNQRGFHIQELIGLCLVRGYAVTLIEPKPFISSPETKRLVENNDLPEDTPYTYAVEFSEPPKTRMDRLMSGNVGVLSGIGRAGTRHSVAWDGSQIIDPADGETYNLDGFRIQYFHLVRKV